MKIYIVSDETPLIKNTGFITGSFITYEEAYERAEVGQFIHAIYVQDVFEIINAGKMSRKVT